MTALPDTAELAPTRDAAAYGGRRLMSAGFWAMMGVCVVCLLAAAGVVFLGPRLWAPRAAAPVLSPAPFPPARVLGAPIAPAVVMTAPTTPLEARVARLESGDARLLNAGAVPARQGPWRADRSRRCDDGAHHPPGGAGGAAGER